MARAALGDFEARSALHIVFEVFGRRISVPIGQRPRSQIGQAFGDENPAHIKPLGQVFYQRAEELLAGHRGGAFNDGLQQLVRAFPVGDLS